MALTTSSNIRETIMILSFVPGKNSWLRDKVGMLAAIDYYNDKLQTTRNNTDPAAFLDYWLQWFY